MNEHLRERTKLGKVWDIHEILPYVGDYCADWGRYNEVNQYGEPDIDWFPSPDDWEMVRDWLGDFGELSPELRLLSSGELDELLDGLAKDYVGFLENDCYCDHDYKYHGEEGCVVCNCDSYKDPGDPDVPNPWFWEGIYAQYGKYIRIMEKK